MSDISQHYHFIQSTIYKYLPTSTKILLFGSRATGTHKPNSDIDILLEDSQPIDRLIMSQITEEFEESNLPYRVDLVDIATTSDNFKKVALQKIIDLSNHD